ncbi:cupin domain-containing protein [Desulfotomaculum copahuensis]|uniref:Cupin n=1 Tax=Desulfotomaculum copahuensis TaxID=1838280 RepID=A0A1B7LEA4_9FIRM|nr:cupin domain-containing protein [Desulfotomaculum copahuensis]OAT81437.1 cupin [Desulfotomaculum copahuensis]
MIVAHEKNQPGTAVNTPGAVNVFKKSLVGPAQGWTGWVMRLFTINSGGSTPRHAHPWPHINYILGGRGVLYLEGKENPVEAGCYAYVPGNAEHQFINSGDGDFTFICIVPDEGDK